MEDRKKPGPRPKINRLVRTSIQLPAWLAETIDLLSIEKDTSKSQIILDALLTVFKKGGNEQ